MQKLYKKKKNLLQTIPILMMIPSALEVTQARNLLEGAAFNMTLFYSLEFLILPIIKILINTMTFLMYHRYVR